MRDKLMSRLEQLKTEFQGGQTKLQDLDIQQSRLRETLLRISGAIQVLEEMLDSEKPEETSRAEDPGRDEPTSVRES